MAAEVAITLRFSRCAPPTWWEMVKALSPKDPSICICRLTHSRFSHVDLLISLVRWGLPGVGLLGASDNPEAPVIVGNPRGVAVRPVAYQRFSIRRDAVIATTPEIKQRFEDFCVDQIGKPFDKGALKLRTFLAPHFERDWRGDDMWYCAEMAGRATEVSNLVGYEYPGVKNRMTAADLLVYLAPKLNFAQFDRPIPYLAMAGPWES